MEIQQETASDGKDSAGGTGAASTGDHRDFVPGSKLHDGRHLLGRSRKNDGIRNPLVDRHVPGIAEALNGVAENVLWAYNLGNFVKDTHGLTSKEESVKRRISELLGMATI
jgi:hypothetical protein